MPQVAAWAIGGGECKLCPDNRAPDECPEVRAYDRCKERPEVGAYGVDREANCCEVGAYVDDDRREECPEVGAQGVDREANCCEVGAYVDTSIPANGLLGRQCQRERTTQRRNGATAQRCERRKRRKRESANGQYDDDDDWRPPRASRHERPPRISANGQGKRQCNEVRTTMRLAPTEGEPLRAPTENPCQRAGQTTVRRVICVLPAGMRLEAMCAQFVNLEPRLHLRSKSACNGRSADVG